MSGDFEREPVAHARARPLDTNAGPGPESRSILSALGNRTAGRILRSLRGTVDRSATGGAVLDETVSRAIHAKRGSGRPLDSSTQRDLGAAMGHDFSDVNVHTDSESDGLNRAVRAEAFTTGKDVFFREGKYDPGSNAGRKLLAHELTHVVQQRDAPPKQELTLSDPGDASERQATSVADSVASPAPAASAGVAREAAPEEEEAATSRVDREEAPAEEEEAATSPVARQEGAEEEEEAATSRVDREEAPPEEEEETAG